MKKIKNDVCSGNCNTCDACKSALPVEVTEIEAEVFADVTENLWNYADDIGKYVMPKLKDNGYIVEDGKIIVEGDIDLGGFIPAMSIAGMEITDKCAPALIVNTVNAGPRYAGVGEDGKAIDLGPVNNPCVIGNAARPYGVYIPITNPIGMHNGIGFALNLFDSLEQLTKQRIANENAMIIEQKPDKGIKLN